MRSFTPTSSSKTRTSKVDGRLAPGAAASASPNSSALLCGCGNLCFILPCAFHSKVNLLLCERPQCGSVCPFGTALVRPNWPFGSVIRTKGSIGVAVALPFFIFFSFALAWLTPFTCGRVRLSVKGTTGTLLKVSISIASPPWSLARVCRTGEPSALTSGSTRFARKPPTRRANDMPQTDARVFQQRLLWR